MLTGMFVTYGYILPNHSMELYNIIMCVIYRKRVLFVRHVIILKLVDEGLG